MTDKQVPAGWYPDPSGNTSKLRYWDGTQWTEQLQDAASVATPAPSGVQPNAPVPGGTYSSATVVPDATQLSTGAKVGMVALGFFLGLIGVLIAWLINKDKPTSKEAVKFSVIGFIIVFVISCISSIAITMLTPGLLSLYS
ncbi:MAG: DUF2510 domain-containing protein [Coriobacteriales bacterium]|jgi:hypothetical protein|nr:DUF2510 domain-containing protein [Coriobacteriales bacterium]